MSDTPDIRVLDAGEVETLVGWAAAEGWNPGLADAAAFRTADPEGFIGAFVDGEMMAGISAVRYGSTFGFIGLYICRPDMRGKGIGRRVWDAGMRHLDGRTIGLDGVPEQQANYASMGFAPLYRTWRWSGVLSSDMFPSAETLVPDADLLDRLIAFDRRHFPGERTDFVAGWVSAPRTTRVVLRDGDIAGYGVIRACREGFKIGPLFATEEDVALSLLGSLVHGLLGAVVHLDVPETATSFAETLARRGMDKGFVTARMYRGPAPALRQEGVFAVTTLELG